MGARNGKLHLLMFRNSLSAVSINFILSLYSSIKDQSSYGEKGAKNDALFKRIYC